MKKRILVTGGSGFIGSAICKKLIAENEVTVVDNNQRGSLKKLESIKDKIRFCELDIRDSQALINSSKDIDCIIHAAYVNGTEDFYIKPKEIVDIAIKGMMNVLEACKINSIKELVLLSSSEVYHHAKIIPTPETIPLIIPDIKNPRFSYGGGKIASELMLMNYCKEDFKKAIIVRPHNVYGVSMGWEHVIPQLITKINLLKNENRKDLEIQGDGSETRAFIHIDDFVDGFDIALKKAQHLEIVNIGSDKEIKIIDLVKTIIKLMNFECEIKSGKLREGSTLRRCPDISKMRSLGFNPNIDLEESLPSIIEWYSKNQK
jgi:nucleoside-diphosphate-sugar epimerase